MIHIKPSITARDFVDEREFLEAMYDAHSAMGVEWHTRMLPWHWMPGAAEKYGHAPRSPAYLKRKRLMYERRWRDRTTQKYVQGSGTTDNLYTGLMREQLSRASTIRASRKRVTITMTGPRYITMKTFDGPRHRAVREGWTYGKGKKFSATAGKQPDKAKEIAATTREERERLAVVADRKLEEKAAGW